MLLELDAVHVSEPKPISVHELAPAVTSVQVSLLGVTSFQDSEPGVTGDHSSPNILPKPVTVALPVILPKPYHIEFGLPTRVAVHTISPSPAYSTPPRPTNEA